MRDFLHWSLPIASQSGVRVRLHALFLIASIAMVHAAFSGPATTQVTSLTQAFLAWVVLIASTLLHEIAHVCMARRLGGTANQIILWPFGGLTTPGQMQKPVHDMAIGLAGPAANLGVALVAFVAMYGTGANLQTVFQWMPPLTAGPQAWQLALALTVWCNAMLALLNLLPTSPFDGGRILRSVFWPHLGFRRATLLVSRCAMGASALVFVAGWILQSQGQTAPALGCSALAMIVAFSAWHESKRLTDPPPEAAAKEPLQWTHLGGLDLQPEASYAHSNTWLQQWRQRRQAEKARKAKEQEEADERRMDDILARICESGLEKLPAEDKALLDRVSARYRQRAQGRC